MNLKLSNCFANTWHMDSVGQAMKWCKHRALGVYVHFLSTTQAAGFEKAPLDGMKIFVPLTPKSQDKFLRALLAVGLLEAVHGEPNELAIVHNRGLAALRAKRQEIGRAGGKKSGTTRKTAPAKKRGRKPKSETAVTTHAEAQEQTALQRHCHVAWQCYHDAYLASTGQPPVRNAKANSLIQSIVKQLGSEAPEVLQFYCGHPRKLYVNAVFPLELAARDATALRTQWRNGRYVTEEQVRQFSHDHAYQARLRNLGGQ